MAEKKARKSFQTGRTVRLHRSKIVPDDVNPRTMSEANMKRLKESIRKNGLVGPLVWNATTGHVVGGHQRLAALDSLMRTDDYELDVTEVAMSLRDEVRLNVALNNADAQGEFDFAMLGQLAADFGLDVAKDFGFSPDTVEISFPSLEPSSAAATDAPRREATPEEIARMKEAKREAREKLKADREELGDYNTDPKGILTIVFANETAKREWLAARGVEDADVVHIDTLEAALSAASAEA